MISREKECKTYNEIDHTITHLSWPIGIGLGLGSLLLLKVSGSIISHANLKGLV